ncbi:hypothetical protein HanRHA438_Chr15g0684711 [Helianthus annuus]|nr:hypothetical protein HanRHA438_Chr15g0684711 [Helianthus annuus]
MIRAICAISLSPQLSLFPVELSHGPYDVGETLSYHTGRIAILAIRPVCPINAFEGRCPV